jgi:hypothetical protein
MDKMTNFQWNLVIIYGAAQISGKEIFLSEFSILCQKVKGPTLFGVNLILLERAVRKVMGALLVDGVLFSMRLLSIIISWNYT